MDDDADSLRERDPFYEHRPVPLGAPVGKPRTTWRDVIEFLLGERTARQLWPKYPRRPANFFTSEGKPHYHGHRKAPARALHPHLARRAARLLASRAAAVQRGSFRRREAARQETP